MATADYLTTFNPRKWYVSRNYSEQELLKLVHEHDVHRSAYQKLSDYYGGKHDIFYRKFEDPTKPNNRIVNNYAKLIVDTSTAYFLGEEVTYVSKDKKHLDALAKVHKRNNAHDVNAELGKLSGIHGHAFEVHWIDKNGDHRFKYVSAYNAMMVYSMDIEEEPVAAIVYHNRKDVITKGTVRDVTIYTEDKIIDITTSVEGGEILARSEKEHLFGEVPVVEVIANEERTGDFEPVLTLIDAYNIAVSDSVNDIEYWNDSYLLLRNLNATTPEDIRAMKENRVMLIDGDGEAKFISKDINDHHIQNIKDRLTTDIHKFSQTPNLNDEQFATNLSGVAIKYKMLGLENKTAIKERKFATALTKRNRLITRILNLKGGDYSTESLDVTFVRNLPANIVELADMIVKLKNTVSDETLRAQLPFIHDLEEEAKKMKKQQQEMFADYGAGLMKPQISPQGVPMKTPEEQQQKAKFKAPVKREEAK